MEIKKVYVTGRYIEQVASIKLDIKRNSKLLWELEEKPENASLLLFFDCIEEELLTLPAFKVLVRQEPRMVLPKNYRLKNLAKFDQIVNVGRPIDGVETNINWPQKIRLSPSIKFAKKQSKAVLINSNLISLDDDEMYSLRRILSYRSSDIDLYGYGWNKGIKSSIKALLIEIRRYIHKPLTIKIKGMRYYFRNQENYKGSVKNKNFTMEKYRIAIIIENSLGYVSEKIFDSFSAGCIPVYVGPDLKRYQIPIGLYIQADPSLDSVNKAIAQAKKTDYAKWLSDLEKWLNSNDCIEKWSEKTFLTRLSKILMN
jgi:hypothetical protein